MENVFIMGDFNTLFSKMDMAEGMVYKSDKGRKELNVLIEENDLIDVWKERNEKKRDYSRQPIVQNFMCQTRIDFILIKTALGKYVEKVYYKETTLSDHKFLFVQMDFNEFERGPGVWVLNSGILKKNYYRMGVERLIENREENKMYKEDKRIWWDNIKYDIKNYSIEYSNYRG